MKRQRAIAQWLMFLPIGVLILLPVLNVLFHIEDAMGPVWPPIVLGVCLLLPFVGAFLFFSDSLGLESERRKILEAGVPARAVVQSVRLGDIKLTIGGVDERWLAVLDLEVQPAGQAPFQAQIKHLVPVLEVPRFQDGAVIEVRYDPGDRTKVAVV